MDSNQLVVSPPAVVQRQPVSGISPPASLIPWKRLIATGATQRFACTGSSRNLESKAILLGAGCLFGTTPHIVHSFPIPWLCHRPCLHLHRLAFHSRGLLGVNTEGISVALTRSRSFTTKPNTTIIVKDFTKSTEFVASWPTDAMPYPLSNSVNKRQTEVVPATRKGLLYRQVGSGCMISLMEWIAPLTRPRLYSISPDQPSD